MSKIIKTAFKVISLSLLSTAIWSNALFGDISDPGYHTVDEIYEEIFALQEEYPFWVRVDSIGHSQVDKLPIYAVKISNDVNEKNSERPAVVINGQLHAEEVIGVEYCMWLLDTIVTDWYLAREWRKKIDIWVIPTCNPEGLRIAHELDESYRKNKRDNIGDGKFRFHPGWGGDTSGVDLNRNYPLFWVHGTPLLGEKAENEKNDYYRGSSPLSEAESRAWVNFCDRVRPLYSMVIHSSRTGDVAELVIYPWQWEKDESKESPDIDAFFAIADKVRLKTITTGGTAPFDKLAMKNAQGDSESYLYWKYGIFAMRIEIGSKQGGSNAVQPPYDGINKLINDNSKAFEVLFNTAHGRLEEPVDQTITRFNIQVLDAAGNPLEARVALRNWITPMIPFRRTNPLNGMYFWLTYPNYQDELIVSKFGYETIFRGVFARANPQDITVRLNELPVYEVNLNVVDLDGQSVSELVDITVEHPDSSWSINASQPRISLDLPQGGYNMTFYCGSKYVPRHLELDVEADIPAEEPLNVPLSSAIVLFGENFDGGDVLITSDNVMNPKGSDSLAHWELTGEIFHTPPRCLTDSRRGSTIRNEDNWSAPYNLLDDHFDLSGFQTASLVYWLNQALEPGFDSMWVEVYTPDSGWVQAGPAQQELSVIEQVPIFSWNAPTVNPQKYAPWKRIIVSLDDWCGQAQVKFRYHLRTDGFVEEDGVYIDDVQLLVSGDTPPQISSAPIIPRRFVMGQPYPNPFNGQLEVSINLPQEDFINLRLYDVTGRLVFSAPRNRYVAGIHRLRITANELPSGLYLLRGSTANEQAVRKVMLLK